MHARVYIMLTFTTILKRYNSLIIVWTGQKNTGESLLVAHPLGRVYMKDVLFLYEARCKILLARGLFIRNHYENAFTN